MSWVSDLKWAVKGALAKRKPSQAPQQQKTQQRVQPPQAETPAQEPADSTVAGLNDAGLSQNELDRLMGKKKKVVPNASGQ